MRSILTIICIIALVVAGVWWWRVYHSGSPYDGSVVNRDAAMENGTTTMENGQNLGDEARPTPSRSDAPGTINGDPVRADSYDLGTQTTPISQDPNAANGANAPNAANAANPSMDPKAQLPASRSAQSPQITYNAPAPTAPAIGSTGMYQLYRQGDVTYRVNSQTGSSCVLYATTKEWRKPSIYRNGCHAL